MRALKLAEKNRTVSITHKKAPVKGLKLDGGVQSPVLKQLDLILKSSLIKLISIKQY